jgi:C-terminal processing protease CtpA/Prc
VPAYKIVQIRKDSPADKAGLKVNDIILSINRRDAHTYNLQDLMGIFYGDEGRVVRMLVERNGVQLRYNFTLKSML